jgi:hypothetical protein
MEFRERLRATLRSLTPVLGEGVMVIGSEVPNLLPGSERVPLIVSRDVDLGVEATHHAQIKGGLEELAARGWCAAPDEPSVLTPPADHPHLLEVNFVGIDRRLSDPAENYVLEDDVLPLLVFGALSLLQPGPAADVGEGALVRLPQPAGLLIEKLLSERSRSKGDRDLLVALALLLGAGDQDLATARDLYGGLSPEDRYQVRGNLALLSLLAPLPDMPDPRPHRALVAGFLRALEQADQEARR